MDLNHLRWNDFSGAPTIFLPENLKSDWMGFYSEFPEKDNSSVDLIINSKNYFIDTTFDFENPRTDYDRICAIQEQIYFPFNLKSGTAFVIASGHDLSAWWAKEQILVCGTNEIDEILFQQLKWMNPKLWQLESEKVLVFNACLCPQDADLNESDIEEVTLEKGQYMIEYAEYNGVYCADLFRFKKI